jgi:hypothetical protein
VIILARTEMKSGGERSASARPARRMATVAQIGVVSGCQRGVVSKIMEALVYDGRSKIYSLAF